MKSLRFLLVLLLAAAGAELPVAAQSPRNSERPGPHPTRLIAKLKRELGAANRAAKLALDHGLAVRKRFRHSADLLVLNETAAAARALANATPQERKLKLLTRLHALRQSGLFEFVEPDYVLTAHATPSDTAYQNGTLWGLQRIGAASAWDITTGSTNIIVAVVDSGIRHTHQDLAAQMWRNPGEMAGNGLDDDGDGIVDNVHGLNAISDSGDTSDDHSHGTHVAGTIGAAANNAGAVVGVCWQVRLMACKFMDSTGHGYTSDAVECIDFAVANGARVINCSWGGGEYSQALFNSLSAARTAGVLVVVAAGNDGFNNDLLPDYPASFNLDNLFVVAAIDQSDALASFSNYGQTSVDLAAPGVGIYSCTADSDASYDTYQGTSMAAPHVTGVMALLLAQTPGLSLATLRQRLLGSTVSLASLSGRCVTGGRVDAFKALSTVPDGVLEISTATSSAPPFSPGSSVNFFVNVSDVSPVTNATVTGGIVGGSSLAFGNNGVSPDATARDGTYSAVLAVPSTGSNVTVRVVVSAPGKQTATNSATIQILQPPANDRFASRAALTGTTATTTASNVGATKETGEPAHAGNAGGRSVWWTWTAPADGAVTIGTMGSDFDTLLGVYTGAAVSALSVVAANDNQGFLPFSSVSFTATAGTPYQIAVDGFGGASGSIQLNLKMSVPPPNDAFASRLLLVGANVTTTGNNENATKEPGEPLHAGNTGGRSVWWTWTAPSSGPVRAATTGSDFDTTLAVYIGTSVGALTLIAADDDSGGWPASAVTFTAVAGMSYQFAVDGFDDGFGFGAPAGNIRLSIAEQDRLHLLPPQKLSGGGYRLWIAAADGTALSSSRAARIEVHALARVNQVPDTATRLNAALSFSSGRLWLDDLTSPKPAMRFYRVLERAP
ncbi:MAG: S8 family serine peptidase [Verrucomicrobia bacterium]|nr:S8 family serine peptidase [Verrucomicrobiota bacterium]